MGKIKIKDINIYAYHGCFVEERAIGSEYKVDVSIVGDFTAAEKGDKLKDTIDYVAVSDIVVQEMQIPSKLIEHVADRIVTRIISSWPVAKCVKLVVKKATPPMNVYAESVEYVLERSQ